MYIYMYERKEEEEKEEGKRRKGKRVREYGKT